MAGDRSSTKQIVGAVTDIFDVLVGSLSDTRLEPDLDDLLWSVVNVFHRAVFRIERQLDDNEQAQRRLQQEQDGTEIKSVELENLTAQGITMIERRDAFELMRDQAADRYEQHTGSAWHPRTGSQVNHRHLTAALIDSRDFLAAKRKADTEVMLPPGPKIALTGGLDFNDHQLIWDTLDKVHAKHADMVLIHGKSPKGAELIASKWADARKVPQIGFAPNWDKHGRAAPFKRNDAMLDLQLRRQGEKARHQHLRLPKARRRMSAVHTIATPICSSPSSAYTHACAADGGGGATVRPCPRSPPS